MTIWRTCLPMQEWKIFRIARRPRRQRAVNAGVNSKSRFQIVEHGRASSAAPVPRNRVRTGIRFTHRRPILLIPNGDTQRLPALWADSLAGVDRRGWTVRSNRPTLARDSRSNSSYGPLRRKPNGRLCWPITGVCSIGFNYVQDQDLPRGNTAKTNRRSKPS